MGLRTGNLVKLQRKVLWLTSFNTSWDSHCRKCPALLLQSRANEERGQESRQTFSLCWVLHVVYYHINIKSYFSFPLAFLHISWLVFMSTQHRLESFWNRELQLRKYLHQTGLWASLRYISFCLMCVCVCVWCVCVFLWMSVFCLCSVSICVCLGFLGFFVSMFGFPFFFFFKFLRGKD